MTDPAGLTGRRLVHVAATDRALDALLGSTLPAAVAEGMEVVAVSGPGPGVAVLHERGIRHVPLRPVDPSASAAGRLVAGRALVRLLGGLAPDIVHTHGPVPVPLGPVAARVAGVARVVHSAHGPLVDPGDAPGHRVALYGLERLTAACSRFVLVDHPDDLAVLARLRVPADRLVLVGDGVDLDRFRPRRTTADVARARAALGVDPSALVVGVVGHPTGADGRCALASVAARLHDLRPEVVLVVLGATDAPDGDAVEDLHAGVDLVVVADGDRPSRSALQALAGGLPVVATATPGGRQVVDDGVNGRLVPVGNVGALTAAVLELVGDPARRGTMGARSRIRAEATFDARQVARATLDVYRRLPVGPPPAGTAHHGPAG
jgi:glycosyltransferase involved in cell wall biosynthesis